MEHQPQKKPIFNQSAATGYIIEVHLQEQNNKNFVIMNEHLPKRYFATLTVDTRLPRTVEFTDPNTTTVRDLFNLLSRSLTQEKPVDEKNGGNTIFFIWIK